MKAKQREPWLRDKADQSMRLPAGSTCGDCRNFDWCSRMVGRIAPDEVCDWSPSRFDPIAWKQ